MSERSKDALHDDILAFDNYMEAVSDTSVLELTVDPGAVQPSPCPAVPEPGAADRRVDVGSNGQCKALWRQIHRLLSSSVGLVVLLIIYTLVGAALLHYTEYEREVIVVVVTFFNHK